MNVMPVPSGVRLIAPSDFEEKLVVRLIPCAAASAVTLTVFAIAPVVVLTFDRYRSDVMPKFASASSLFQTFTEQFAFPQKALDAVAVTPAELGNRAPTANPGSV